MKYIEIDGKKVVVRRCIDCPCYDQKYAQCQHPSCAEFGVLGWYTTRDWDGKCPLREVESVKQMETSKWTKFNDRLGEERLRRLAEKVAWMDSTVAEYGSLDAYFKMKKERDEILKRYYEQERKSRCCSLGYLLEEGWDYHDFGCGCPWGDS